MKVFFFIRLISVDVVVVVVVVVCVVHASVHNHSSLNI